MRVVTILEEQITNLKYQIPNSCEDSIRKGRSWDLRFYLTVGI